MAAKKKTPSAADFRKKEEADKKKVSRTDYSGATGFGHTTQSFSGPAGEYKTPSRKSAENYLRSKGVNPDSYTNKTGGNKGNTPKMDMALASSPQMSKPWSKAYWSDWSGGGTTVNGIPRLFKGRETTDPYKRVTAEIKLKASEVRGMNSKGKVVPNKKKK